MFKPTLKTCFFYRSSINNWCKHVLYGLRFGAKSIRYSNPKPDIEFWTALTITRLSKKKKKKDNDNNNIRSINGMVLKFLSEVYPHTQKSNILHSPGPSRPRRPSLFLRLLFQAVLREEGAWPVWREPLIPLRSSLSSLSALIPSASWVQCARTGKRGTAGLFEA